MWAMIGAFLQIALVFLKHFFDPERRKEMKEEKKNEEIEKVGVALYENRLRLVGKMIDNELRRKSAPKDQK
jgi:hypothetical protein